MRAWATLDSPLGPLRLEARGEALVGVGLPPAPPPEGEEAPDAPVLAAAAAQLRAWFDGRRPTFDLPLAPEGSPLQQRVWALLREIPPGTTTTYGALAATLGLRNGARAVGRANGANPLPIVVPCHRVVGADGRLVGYAGGLPAKRWLLAHEARWWGPPALFPT